MSRALNDLNLKFRPLAIELLARLTEAGIPVLITDTLRTAEEQKVFLARGTSKVKHSKHQDGLAIDVVPYETYSMNGPDKLNWDTDSTASIKTWKIMGTIGKSLGLRWGGDFRPLDRNGLGWDPGHFEFVEKEK